MSGVAQPGGLGRAVDILSAGLFAGAAGYSSLLLSGSVAASAAAATAAFVGAAFAFGQVEEVPKFQFPEFDVAPFAPSQEEYPELLLTEMAELLLTETVGSDPDELLLEDRLEQPADDSRVIRLFDPRTLPTAGELHERIERHLRDPREAVFPDATTELHQALAALRGSLR